MNARILSRVCFEALSRRPDAEIDLALAAVAIAQEEYPALRASDVLVALSQLAARAPSANPGPPRKAARDLARFLFHEENFLPNEDEYYDPRNTYLNDVLERRLGIPITLALVMLEVGKRLGLPLVGIGFPGRFLVGLAGDADFFVDPFGRGRILPARACREMYGEMTRGKGSWQDDFLAPVTNKQILQRMLRNLKDVFLRREDVPRCLLAVDRLAALSPEDLEEVRDRGVLSLHHREYFRALADLTRYLEGRPEADDAPLIRRHIGILKEQLPAAAT